MATIYSFGEWIKQRRTHLRFTQRAIAEQVFCSTAMIKKIEADERQPSPELAELLAQALQVPPAYRPIFLACARGERPVDTLPLSLDTVTPGAAYTVSLPVKTTLPNPATPFVGRTAELAAITSLLANDDCRLLTLVGAGGIGKTRLAIEAARSVQSAFADRVTFVSLGAVADAAALAQAVAQSLGTPLVDSEPPQAQIQRILQRRKLLLLLDNFEQLIADAPLLAEWLAAAPALKLLVTSRERLNLAEEWLYQITGFDEESAVALFTQAAQKVRPGFDRAGEGAAMTDICRLVGSHALAVELAASWTRLMPCAEIAAQIRQDLDFLAGGPRNAPARHHSLRALFDHSWALLSTAEQVALARLSVFRGGFAAEQAAAVTGATWPVLLGLVDKSLVEATGDQRYDLHELVRQYAARQLAAMRELEPARQQHFATYGALGRQIMHQTTGPQATASFARFDLEHANIQAAVGWGMETNQSEATLALIDSVFLYLLRGGYWREGEVWLQGVLDQAGDAETAQVSVGLCNQAAFVALQGRFQEAFILHNRALPMARKLGDPHALVATLLVQGLASPEPAEAYAALEEAIAISRAQAGEWLGNRYWTELLTIYGDRLLDHGHVVEAEAKYRESLAGYRLLEDVNMIAYPLGNLGRLALFDGRLEEAHQLINEAVGYARGGNRVALADWLFRLGQVHLYRGELAAAAEDLNATLTLYEEVNNKPGQASVLACLAEVALAQGDVPAAGRQIRESMTLYRAIYMSIPTIVNSSRHTQSSDATESILRAGLVAAAQGNYLSAVTLLNCGEAIVAESGYRSMSPLGAKVKTAMALAQARLSAAEFLEATERGRHMNLEEVFLVA